MTKVIAIANQKGGVGKTSTTVNLSAGLVRADFSVLAIDFDPQANLTMALGFRNPDDMGYTVSSVLAKAMNEEPINPAEGILTSSEGIDLMPSSIQLSRFELALVNEMNRESMLRQFVEAAKLNYDYILIDCAPSEYHPASKTLRMGEQIFRRINEEERRLTRSVNQDLTKQIRRKRCRRNQGFRCGMVSKKMRLDKLINYVINPDKTDDYVLTYFYNCPRDGAARHMKETKKRYSKADGIQAFHIIQAFNPGEITPELAHEVANRFIKEHLSEFEVVLGTHVDRGHIHNHIILNSVSFMDGHKYHSTARSYYREIRAISDRLCRERGLSVIMETHGKAMSYAI